MGRPRANPRESVRAECRVVRDPRPRCPQLSCCWRPLQSRCCMTKTVNPMFFWQMVNVEGGTWGKMRSSSFAHLSLSSYSKTIMSFMMQFFHFRSHIITSCDEKESHAGDLGNLKVHLVLCTPEVQKENFLCTFGYPGDRLWRG